jgi:hypothetical protein
MQYKITLIFDEDVLGTVPMDKEIYDTYIASKAVNGTHALMEAESILVEDKGKTGFHRLNDGTPFLYDYVIKGFCKDACGMMSRVEGSESKKIRAYKKIIDGLVFVRERRIPFDLIGEIGELQRPLRAQTAQGERVALAYSESIPAGSSITFTLDILDDKTVTEALLREWLNYGRYRGLGQWRNASYGRFEFEMEPVQATA